MAFNEDVSFIEYPVDQPTQDFVTNFDTIGGTTDVVLVTVDGVLTDTPESSYTVQQINHTTWRVTPEVPTGSVVRLYRVTNLDELMHVFTAGAKFIARNVDSNFKQIRHAQQEVRDAFTKLNADVTGRMDGFDGAIQAAKGAANQAESAAVRAESAANTSDYYLRYYDPAVLYPLHARIMLANGGVVKSTVADNTTDPNVDMTGWDNESEKLSYSLAKTNNLLDYFTRQEKSDYIANPSTYDATAIVIRALADADILDCRKLSVGISTSVVVREGCQCLNANFFNLNVVDASILVNTSSRVTGKVTGSGAGLATVERAIFAANDSVKDVYLDIEVTNLTVGVQVSGSNALLNECSGWHGVLRFKNLTGGGTNSTGYGVLLPRAKNCEFLVYADNVPRHDVYLSAGATGNTILCYSKNSKGSPLSIASYADQDANTDNNVTMHIENCTPQSSSSPYAAVITGRSQKNDIYLYGQSSPLLDGAIVFRSLASDAVCHGNYAYLNWTGGSSGVLAFNQSSFNNDFDIIGDGGCVNANVSLISANTYQSITTFSEGAPKYTARLRSFKWDGAKLAAGHVAYAYAVGQFTGIANFDIGEGILKGANGFATRKVRVDLGAIIGSTHRERIVTTGVSVPANGAQDFTVNYSEAYGNVSIPVASLVAPSASVANSVELAITARSNSTVTFKAINKAGVAQTMFVVGEVSGY